MRNASILFFKTKAVFAYILVIAFTVSTFLLFATPKVEAQNNNQRISGSQYDNDRGRDRDRQRGGGVSIDLGGVIGAISRAREERRREEAAEKRRQKIKKRRKVRKKSKPKRRAQKKAPQRAQPVSLRAPIPEFRTNQILILFPSTSDDSLIDAVANDYNLTRLDDSTIDILDARLVKFSTPPNFGANQTLQLANDPRVIRIQQNFVYSLSGSQATKKKLSKQYALRKLDVPKAHNLSTGKDVVIAVIDSRIQQQHPALKGAVLEEFDAIGIKTKFQGSHGTQVASLIAARDPKKMLGIAPDAKLLAIRAFAKEDKNLPELGETFHLVRGIDWAVTNSAQILNLSFAGPRDATLEEALNKAAERGIIMVAAAGNRGKGAKPAYPAAYENVIAVTATDAKNKIYKHANRGDYITIAAPGVRVLTASGKNRYTLRSGTSMAAAYVSGVFALALQKTPQLNDERALLKIEITSQDLGKEGHDQDYGYGLINSYRMLMDDPEKMTYNAAQR